MVNNKEIGERLKLIMNYYQLSAASFADKIDVQRSSISHLLSGRNKPSLDFVLKVLEHFAEVDLNWLMYGKGSFPKKEMNFIQTQVKNESPKPIEQYSFNSEHQKIEKIVLFYYDGTFKEFDPKQ